MRRRTEPRCASCRYSFAGLTPLNQRARPPIYRCPECGWKGGGLEPLERWRRASRLLAGALQMLGLTVAVSLLFWMLGTWVGGMASAPLQRTLVHSDLVFEDLGTGDVILDRRRWSEEVAGAMLAASGGWAAALRPATLCAIVVISLVAFGYGRALTTLRVRCVLTLLAIVGASAAALAGYRLLTHSESSPYWSYSASSRATSMVAYPIGSATIALWAAALAAGVAVPHRKRAHRLWLIEADGALPGPKRRINDWSDTGPFG